MKHLTIILTKLQLRFLYEISGSFVQKNNLIDQLKPETYVMRNLIDKLIVFGDQRREIDTADSTVTRGSVRSRRYACS